MRFNLLNGRRLIEPHEPLCFYLSQNDRNGVGNEELTHRIIGKAEGPAQDATDRTPMRNYQEISG